MSLLAERALAEAITMIGQTEHPLDSNWGHPVQDFLASVGIYEPAPWCMAYVYWCYQHAAGQLKMSNPLQRTGRVKTQWDSRRMSQLVIGPDGRLRHVWEAHLASHINPAVVSGSAVVPMPGDIFIMLFEGGNGHCGIIEKIAADGSFQTIEGNTNEAGGREGIAIEPKQRHLVPPMVGLLRF